jgi:hypothetical protein
VDVDSADIAAFKEIRSVLSWVLTQVRSFHPEQEELADYLPRSRFLGIPTRAKMVRVGSVWRLGVFLLSDDGLLFQAGEVTRVAEPPHPGHVSAYREERREFMEAALRGGFSVGEVVNFNTFRITLDMDELRQTRRPLFISGPHAYVRWREGAPDSDALLFKNYMAERLELLLNPPKRANEAMDG